MSEEKRLVWYTGKNGGKPRQYKLLFIKEYDGKPRAKLTFMDESNEFWVDGDKITYVEGEEAPKATPTQTEVPFYWLSSSPLRPSSR